MGSLAKRTQQEVNRSIDRLRLHSLKLQSDECEFLKKEMCYLGHRVTPQGFRPDEGKAAAVRGFLCQTIRNSLRHF
jgi:hypothetical protein